MYYDVLNTYIYTHFYLYIDIDHIRNLIGCMFFFSFPPQKHAASVTRNKKKRIDAYNSHCNFIDILNHSYTVP